MKGRGSKMKGNKNILVVMLFIFMIFICPTTIYADIGPKDNLVIYVKNPPNENYYLDLLTTQPGTYSNLGKSEERVHLNQDMLQLLYSQEDEGWYPALTEGTNIPMWGKLIGEPHNDKMIHKFSYLGVPETYRIIIVTESGKVTLSDTYTRKALQSSIHYDYETNTGRVPSPIFAYLIQFLTTCIPTLMIEFIVLLLFRFKIKDNYKVFLVTNLATQILLTATLGTALILKGSLAAYFTQFPMEIFILIIETTIYTKWLKGHTPKRKRAYGIVANLLSWGVGFFLIAKQYEFLVTFM